MGQVEREALCGIRHSTHQVYDVSMAVIHISEEEAAKDFSALLQKAHTGEEFIIESELGALRVSRITEPERGFLRPRYSSPRLLSEILADLEANPSSALMPEGFAADLEAVIKSHENEMVFDPWAAS